MLFSTMNYDLIVIGSGPAGQKAALQGAKAGKKVAIIEEYTAIGGGCVHFGTLPSKSFRESVYRWSLGSRGTLGKSSSGASLTEADLPRVSVKNLPDMSRLLKRKERVVSDEAQIIFDQLKRNSITILHGKARIKSRNEVVIVSPKGKKTIIGEFIIVAVGARPVSPAHLSIDGKRVVDSNSVLNLKKLPKSMVVLGAGIIGCEYASMFGMAGTKVHLIDRRHEILASVDREIVNHLVERFVSLRMEISLRVEASRLELLKNGVRVHLSDGRKVTVDTVLVTLGRCGNTEGLGLQEVGVETDERGLVKVDKSYRTNVPNIFAVGDVVGMPALASTSMEQGRIACCNAFELDRSEMSPLFPYGIYTIPEISMVGPTEEEFVAKKADFVVGRARYRELARGQIVGDRWGLLKLIVDKKTLKLLAVHIIGDNAAELVHIGQAVMAFDGDVKYFIRTVFNYPTLAEAYKTAAFHAVNQIRGATQSR
jgi:NAD(P) transhydrogenase